MAFIGEWVLLFGCLLHSLVPLLHFNSHSSRGRGFHHIDLVFLKDEKIGGITVHRAGEI